MSYRSWLQDVKTVFDIDSTALMGRNYHEKLEVRSERNWEKRRGQEQPIPDQWKPYFGSSRHDSGLISIERTERQLSIVLDDIDGYDFEGVMSSILGIEHRKRNWLVTLEFHDPVYFRTVRADPKGGLRFADIRNHLSETEFLYDWFYAQDNRLQWVGQFWNSEAKKSEYLTANVYFLIDCSHVSVKDARRWQAVKMFGEPAGLLFDDAWQHPGLIWSIWPDLEDFLRQRMKDRGLGRDEFLIVGQ